MSVEQCAANVEAAFPNYKQCQRRGIVRAVELCRCEAMYCAMHAKAKQRFLYDHLMLGEQVKP